MILAKDKKYRVVVIYTVSVLLLTLSWFLIIQVTPIRHCFSNSNYSIKYSIYDEEDPIDDIISDPTRVASLKKYYKDLTELDDYSFYEEIYQPADIQYFDDSELFSPDTTRPNIFLNNGTQYITVNQLLLNRVAFEAQNFSLQLGELFTEEDYNIGSDYNIPVILGSDYLGKFKVNDRISCLNYYEVPTCMVVKGILEQNSSITLNEEEVELDKYIIAVSPNFNFFPKTEDEVLFHGLLYFQKINGEFVLNRQSDINSVFTALRSIEKSNEMFPLHILQYPISYQNAISWFFSCSHASRVIITIFLILFALWADSICVKLVASEWGSHITTIQQKRKRWMLYGIMNTVPALFIALIINFLGWDVDKLTYFSLGLAVVSAWVAFSLFRRKQYGCIKSL